MRNEPQYCSIRRHFCACEQRCDDRPDAGRAFDPRMKCDHCSTMTELYGSHPMCRECMATVCTDCGTDYDAETGRITCNECAKDADLAADSAVESREEHERAVGYGR